jgi:energy-coupling factor transporter ATP-binding protein EcfA2
MGKTKLILVEGLPGSGKSTTAQLINDILIESKVDTKLFLEGNPDHPADYEYSSFFTAVEFTELLEQFPEMKPILLKHVVERCNGYILSHFYLKQELKETAIPDTFWEKIFVGDIYELPLEKNIELITDKWKRFTESALKGDQTYIFECCFIQNPVTIGMIKYGACKAAVSDYVNQLAAIIKLLNPTLIYVEQQDLSRTFKRAVDERSKEWSSGFIDYYNNQGYGKGIGAEGLEGTLAVLEARYQLEKELFDALDMHKLRIDNFDISLHKSRLKEQLFF